ncbi:MAG: hypothetical protein QNJ45_03115 [Ardenticatenaceae bacterium]|nr:hypothetical protein [Ardenticatenaceae bacterium]
MGDILHQPGFLGTAGNFAADMTLLLSIVVAITFSVGFWAARQHKYTLHGWIQTAGALLNIILVLWMMVLPFRDFVVQDISPPRPRPDIFYYVTIAHATIGFIALVFGNFVVLRGHNLMIPQLKFNNYKPYMRWAYGLYMAATALGILVYIIWFVVIPNPPLFK